MREGNICISSNPLPPLESNSCMNPDLSKIFKGEFVKLCDGTISEGSYIPPDPCKITSDQKCVIGSQFKLVDPSKIDATKVANGYAIAGVIGTKRDVRACRNSANLAYNDNTPIPSTIKIPSLILSAPGGNAVQLMWNHGLSNNDPIQLFCSGGTGTILTGGGVITNVVYYAAVVSANRIQFQATPSGGAVTITGTGGCSGGGWVVSSPADGLAQDIDTLDDRNGFATATSSPSNNPWGSDYICNESNFTNLTGTSTNVPSNNIPTNGNQSWTQIWKDELTGLTLTNILYDAVPNNTEWYQLNALCQSLNNFSAGTGWRLPTQKELLQLYIDGISKVPLAGGSTNTTFWSSTGVSYFAYDAWIVNLSSGNTTNSNRINMNSAVLCVK